MNTKKVLVKENLVAKVVLAMAREDPVVQKADLVAAKDTAVAKVDSEAKKGLAAAGVGEAAKKTLTCSSCHIIRRDFYDNFEPLSYLFSRLPGQVQFAVRCKYFSRVFFLFLKSIFYIIYSISAINNF